MKQQQTSDGNKISNNETKFSETKTKTY